MNSRYQEWLTHVFDHDVEDRYWYHKENASEFEASSNEMADLLNSTFLRAGKDLAKYSDAQVDQGIWYLVSSTGSPFMLALESVEVSLAKRRESIGNILHLYSDCYAERCAESLGSLSEAGRPLNSSCYMFWELCTLTDFADHPEKDDMENAVLAVLERILSIPHRACRESAFHGLGHMVDGCSEKKAHDIIVEFLAKTSLDDQLLVYATKAAEGDIL